MLRDLYSDLSKSHLYFSPAAAIDLFVFFHASGVVCVVEGELDINSELLKQRSFDHYCLHESQDLRSWLDVYKTWTPFDVIV